MQTLIQMKVIIIAISTGLTVIVMMGKTLVINLDRAHDKTTEAVTMEVEMTTGKTPPIALLTRMTTARATMEMPVKMTTSIPMTKVAVTVTQTPITMKHEDREHTSHLLNEATRHFSPLLKCQLAQNQAPWNGGRTQMTWNSNLEAVTMLVSGHLSLMRGEKNVIMVLLLVDIKEFMNACINVVMSPSLILFQTS